MRIIWSPRAKKKVTEYGDYIAQDNPDAAKNWIEGILDEVEKLKDFPKQGRKVLEVRGENCTGSLSYWFSKQRPHSSFQNLL